MKLGAGYPMGPFQLLDYTGLDLHKETKFLNLLNAGVAILAIYFQKKLPQNLKFCWGKVGV